MFDNNERFLVIDTETTNDLDYPFVYDIGFAVIDIFGNVYETHSYVIADIFLDNQLMESAFFKDKIPSYWEEIKSGQRKLRRLKTVKSILRDVCNQYGIKIAMAHNASFDNRSLNTTQRYLTCSKFRYFLPYGLQWWDTLKMAREVLGDNEDYTTFCYNNDYLTERGRIRYTAEIIHRFLSGQNDFIEAHTALEDVMIEKDIFSYCIQAKPEIDGALWRRKDGDE